MIFLWGMGKLKLRKNRPHCWDQAASNKTWKTVGVPPLLSVEYSSATTLPAAGRTCGGTQASRFNTRAAYLSTTSPVPVGRVSGLINEVELFSLAQPGYAGNGNETTSQMILVAFLSPGRVHGEEVKAGWEPKMLRYLWFSCHVKQVVTAVQCHPSGFSGLCWSYHLLQCQRSRPVFRGPVEILGLI